MLPLCCAAPQERNVCLVPEQVGIPIQIYISFKNLTKAGILMNDLFQEISATYTAIAVVSTFVVLHLPRIAASTHEVAHTKLIISCLEAGRQYIPTLAFYKLDTVARLLMVFNSAINFIIYCAVNPNFKVRNKKLVILFLRNLPLIPCSPIESGTCNMIFIVTINSPWSCFIIKLRLAPLTSPTTLC